MRELTITEKHLDRALAVPWSTVTCVVAQCLSEALGPLSACGYSTCRTLAGDAFQMRGHENIQGAFDYAGLCRRAGRGDKLSEQDLRAMLPVVMQVAPPGMKAHRYRASAVNRRGEESFTSDSLAEARTWIRGWLNKPGVTFLGIEDVLLDKQIFEEYPDSA